ncbi:hypothetical protein H920_13195 [Fukomys damarensis]|uniref:Uncharacterized protein n=1 Tax=Fukomys damarensis TaxID=885580 RepID=A0A091D020_FUKDA|nr:hypothetical protein H920_13195 [Fukomys damarensis]
MFVEAAENEGGRNQSVNLSVFSPEEEEPDRSHQGTAIPDSAEILITCNGNSSGHVLICLPEGGTGSAFAAWIASLWFVQKPHGCLRPEVQSGPQLDPGTPSPLQSTRSIPPAFAPLPLTPQCSAALPGCF